MKLISFWCSDNFFRPHFHVTLGCDEKCHRKATLIAYCFTVSPATELDRSWNSNGSERLKFHITTFTEVTVRCSDGRVAYVSTYMRHINLPNSPGNSCWASSTRCSVHHRSCDAVVDPDGEADSEADVWVSVDVIAFDLLCMVMLEFQSDCGGELGRWWWCWWYTAVGPVGRCIRTEFFGAILNGSWMRSRCLLNRPDINTNTRTLNAICERFAH